MIVFKKLLKYLLLLTCVLTISFVLYIEYLKWSFDSKSLPENHGQVKAELFLGDGQQQALIVGFGGSEGGNAWASDYWKEQRDRFLEQGYAILTIGYFGMEGTPSKLDRISLDAIHAVIQETVQHAKINKDCVALMGGSKGAELALSLASYFDSYSSAIAFVPGHSIFASLTDAMVTSSFSLNQEPLDFVPVKWNAAPALIKGDLRGAFEKMLEDKEAVERARINIENIKGSILLLSATQDEMWPSSEMSEEMIQTLSENDFPYEYKHIAIKGNHAAPLEHFDKVESFLKKNFCN